MQIEVFYDSPEGYSHDSSAPPLSRHRYVPKDVIDDLMTSFSAWKDGGAAKAFTAVYQGGGETRAIALDLSRIAGINVIPD